MLDGAKQVIGLENEYHLAVHEGQHVCNLPDVELGVGLDFISLKDMARSVWNPPQRER